jgi:hypothetical protein
MCTIYLYIKYICILKGTKMHLQTYPTWNEIKDEVSKEDLLEIMEAALEIGLKEAQKDYIEATYYTYEEIA